MAMIKRLHKVLYEMDKSDAVRKMSARSQALALPTNLKECAGFAVDAQGRLGTALRSQRVVSACCKRA